MMTPWYRSTHHWRTVARLAAVLTTVSVLAFTGTMWLVGAL